MEYGLLLIPIFLGLTIFCFSLYTKWYALPEYAAGQTRLKKQFYSLESPLTNLSVNLISISASLWLFAHGLDVQKQQSDKKKIDDYIDNSYAMITAIIEKNASLLAVRSRAMRVINQCNDQNGSTNISWYGHLTTIISASAYISGGSINLEGFANDSKDISNVIGPFVLKDIYRTISSLSTNRIQVESNRATLEVLHANILAAKINNQKIEAFSNDSLKSATCDSALQLRLAINAIIVESLSQAFSACVVRSALSKNDSVFLNDFNDRLKKLDSNGGYLSWGAALDEANYFDKFLINGASCKDYTHMDVAKSLGLEWGKYAGDLAIRN